MPELIDRQEALDIAMSYCPDDGRNRASKYGRCSKAGHDLREMLDEIEELPIVHIDDMEFNIQNEIQAKKPSRTVEITFVRHGRWIYDETIGGMKHYYCSSCKECDPDNKCFADENQILWFSFCPKCGADMRDRGADNG